MKTIAVLIAGSLAWLMTAIGPALAQDPSLRPNYGAYDLRLGFPPDPFVVAVDAGGNIDAAGLGGVCQGAITNAPDLEARISAGSDPLIFRTHSDTDTTLVVRDPDGRWHCNDDAPSAGPSGLNAEVRIDAPSTGFYHIWVGTYAGGTAPARLIITSAP